MRRLQLHPACKLFPKLGKTELQELADDIKANGLQNSIVLLGGKILDGRNRHAACNLAGVKPRFVDWDGKGSPIEWVISQNLVRRHLTASQRAVVAFDLLPLLEKEAKQRQRRSIGRGKKGAQKCATFSENGNGKASEAAGRIARSSARYVEMVKAINRKSPELLKRIRSGEISISEARKGFTHFFGKRNLPQNIETPAGVCRFLHELISAKYQVRTILDPCAGKGNLTRPWKRTKVVWYEVNRGRDFFSRSKRIDCDLVLCNPPFSIANSNGVERFLKRILEVVSKRTPIALIAPMTFRLDQRSNSNRWRWIRDECPPISSIISLPRDCFQGVDFFCEILLFNTKKLRPHYFLPDDYL